MDAAKRVGDVAQSVPDLERHGEFVDGVANQIVLIQIDNDVEAGYKAVKAVSARDPLRPIIVVSAIPDSDRVLRAMRCGARDFAVLDPDLKDLSRAIMTLATERLGATQGSVVSVYGAKGGCGSTTIAVNFAARLRSKRDLKVMVVDLDLELGNVALFYDLICKYSIAEAVKNMDRLDADLLSAGVSTHESSGVQILAQSDNVEEASDVTPEGLTALTDFLRRNYDVVILDGLRGFDNRALNALDASDHILLVLTQDIPAIKNARRCLDIFDRLGYDPARIHVVLNRFLKGHDIDPIVVSDTLGRAVTATVANDFPTVIGSINRGVVLDDSAPKAGVTGDIAELVKLVAGRGQTPEPDKKGVLSGLFSKKR